MIDRSALSVGGVNLVAKASRMHCKDLVLATAIWVYMKISISEHVCR